MDPVQNVETASERLPFVEVSLLEILLFYLPEILISTYPQINRTIDNMLAEQSMSQTPAFRAMIIDIGVQIMQVWRSIFVKNSHSSLSLQQFLLDTVFNDLDERLLVCFTTIDSADSLAQLFRIAIQKTNFGKQEFIYK